MPKNYAQRTNECPTCHEMFDGRGFRQHMIYCKHKMATREELRVAKKFGVVNHTSEKEPRLDLVNHPPHYTFGKYEVLDVLQDWFANDPLLWQVTKYVARAAHKGSELEDLLKAKFYLDRKIESLK